MKQSFFIILLYLFLIHIQSCEENATKTEYPVENNDEEYSILFIGSSYFNYDNIPGIVYELAKASDREIRVESTIPSGYYLANHSQSSTESIINSRQWDFVILQGVGRLMAYPETYKNNSVYDALVELKRKIKANCNSTKILFCMPWAYEDGMLWAGWSDDYFDMQYKIFQNTIAYAEDIGFMIAPVGRAWNEIMKEEHYLHYLYMSDYNHPSLRGSYLTSCVIYSSIYQENCEGNSYTANVVEASHFQEIASDIVLNNLELWNLK